MAIREVISVYFEGEKAAGLTLAVVGLVAVAWAALVRRGGDWRGMFWPLVVMGALQLAVGVGLYAKTDRQVEGLHAQLASNPQGFYAAEVPRMERVQRNFPIIEVVEIAMLVAGVALAMASKGRLTGWGVGMGITLQAAVMLVFDLLAERRGAVYLEALLRGR